MFIEVPLSSVLFGGAFDPIHNGHCFIAEAARQILGAERVLFLPTRSPRHRAAPSVSPVDRAAMVRLAIAGNPAFALDESDLAEDASGYTADLLPRLRARYPEEPFFFLAGGDSLLRSPWRRLEEILSMLEAFVIAPRTLSDGAELSAVLASLAPEAVRKVRVLALPLVPESSTLIRSERAAGRSARYLLPEPVWRYIEAHDLYRNVCDVG
jgi:nicotinate-nucleotide adenylyltransferase